jgi:hypothetical protein
MAASVYYLNAGFYRLVYKKSVPVIAGTLSRFIFLILGFRDFEIS